MQASVARASRLAADTGLVLMLAVLVVASWGPAGAPLPDWDGAPRAMPQRLLGNGRHLLHLSENPARNGSSPAKGTAETRAAMVRAKVGGRTIDAFGFEEGLLLLNDLNYRPRPMAVARSTSTPPI